MLDQDYQKVLKIGISLSTDRDPQHILETILDSGMQITGCDAGTVYLSREGSLAFFLMKTLSMGVSKGTGGSPIKDMPPVPMREENVCAYAAMRRETVNIPDVHHSGRFDFSGPRRYDAMTGYHTVSMLVVPMENADGELLGVLQLMNALDGNKNPVPFDSRFEIIIRSLGSLAAVELTNIQYMGEIKAQLRSFVEAMATAIDERTPYNGTHTRNVAQYVLLLAGLMNQKHAQGTCEKYFSERDLEQLELAALSHDIGKLIIPRSVMDRADRLGGGLGIIKARFSMLEAFYERDFYKGALTEEAFRASVRELRESLEFIARIDGAAFLEEKDYERVQRLAEEYYADGEGKRIPYLTREERYALSVRRGTLTQEARRLMESHVQMTEKILSKVHFHKSYNRIVQWACGHHEMLDGSGYPRHLKGDEIALETRMITAADIYDALTGEDRPYKKPVSREKAFAILHDMAEEGKLDTRIVNWLEEAVTGGEEY